MPAKIIDGKKVAEKFLKDINKNIKQSKEKPGLAIVLVGKNPASEIYVNFKEKKAREVGLYFKRFNLDKNVSQDGLLRIIDDINQNRKIHGVIVQLPLPDQIDETLVVDSILPHKDADGFTPVNLGSLVNDDNRLVPATARACLELIKSTGQKIAGKNAVVVGRSTIVGKPTALLLLQENATVTVCHSKTKNLKEHTKNADILVVACGKAKLIKKDMVKPGAIVIDVGINRTPNGLVGDVDFDGVKEVAGYITPVPGGVGPMTIAMLLDNTLNAMEIGKGVRF
ncbi:MAG: bifunctional 5,10-methylenetetrahydrofolate dehydrogenase/5,10-methenyltetrahydrofolate cyclohydrolase [Candidatus Woesearchaeota archaeon]|jgi:methylenetetrahydrofolate dehydrogenase (NADP+)/methenyltetrahydrofolate cyclohydrolase|nr:bifunctional 5,10-methylenetetrahydrofolate dehydrogenase/5,10-methenyltetrahydrofolate cyclohydrolase [Candidatus Woesearchaeota archaeon]MDP6265451.1 bifunctional 5,10-methylenetetrahydrofolate dehydrogenase/5,10-methenyltetrahydrofolate cyclohydrolase [Candidatus Woesearchaeota archaeon]MDP7322994.1 bifunctional 5,10-methylenetetrahydrofolate dehydrogenase/5,10-methenyltetrahydrofolate cyclohydrolase [Candidatus Woesearchaeota archaeon]MDP7476712.1 bifunctional 5,10-methylenetetrahydrofola|tara:strand:+ start:1901 stop:2749 length:849 start_codon:yes stop_codon:yes gene_type:complete